MILHSYLCNTLCKFFIKIKCNCFCKTYSVIESTWLINSNKLFRHAIVKNYLCKVLCRLLIKIESMWTEEIKKPIPTLSLLYCGRTVRRSHCFNVSLLHSPKSSRCRLHHGVRLQGPSRRSRFLFFCWHISSWTESRPVLKNLRRIPLMNQLRFYICYFCRVSGRFRIVLDGFRSFSLVLHFSKYHLKSIIGKTLKSLIIINNEFESWKFLYSSQT